MNTKLNRIIYLLIFTVIVFLRLNIFVSYGAEVIDSEMCGDNLSWTLDSDGLLTISGYGEMWDKPDDNYTSWNYHSMDITAVTINDGAENISQNAFWGCRNLRRITIPNSVKTIERHAFYLCTALTSVEIPAGTTNIELLAFEDCESLTAINVSSGNTVYKSINGILFSKNGKTIHLCPLAKPNMQNYQIPNGVEIIDEYAFYNNKSLKTITFPSTLTTILGGSFCWCTYLENVSFPSSLTYIGPGAFSFCDSIKTITIPASVNQMGGYVFESCDSLESAVFSHGTTEIPDSIFSGNASLKEVFIPVTVNSIKSSAFFDCSGLTDVYYGGSEDQFSDNIRSIGSLNTDLFQATFHYNTFRGNPNFILPTQLQRIESKAFSGIQNSVFRLPENVSYIASDAFDSTSVLLVPSGSATESMVKKLNVTVIRE